MQLSYLLNKKNIRLVFEKALKKFTSRLYQLKIGHKVGGTYLAKIEIIKAFYYWWYREKIQLVKYLYIKYPKLRKKQRKLVYKLEKKGII